MALVNPSLNLIVLSFGEPRIESDATASWALDLSGESVFEEMRWLGLWVRLKWYRETRPRQLTGKVAVVVSVTMASVWMWYELYWYS
jgi:hypothetical protein